MAYDIRPLKNRDVSFLLSDPHNVFYRNANLRMFFKQMLRLPSVQVFTVYDNINKIVVGAVLFARHWYRDNILINGYFSDRIRESRRNKDYFLTSMEELEKKVVPRYEGEYLQFFVDSTDEKHYNFPKRMGFKPIGLVGGESMLFERRL